MAETAKKLINQIQDKLKKGDPIRISLPGKGTLKMDKHVPFLLIYRIPETGKDFFTYNLTRTESAYLIAPDNEACPVGLIVNVIADYLADKFGGFMLVEIWLADHVTNKAFTIHLNQKGALSMATKLTEELSSLRIGNQFITAKLDKQKTSVAPPRASSLIDKTAAKQSEIVLIGVEIVPIYNDTQTGKPYPLFVRELRTAFGKALRKSLFEFVRTNTSYNITHFEMLGTTVLDDNVWKIDQELADYSNLFDFLLLVTPINVAEAWKNFAKNNYLKSPVFHYRPMPIEPELIKRKIYNLPIEDISDPTIAFLFRDKRKEIDRMLNMMLEREKPDFMHSSLQVFGNIDEHLLEVAQAILVAADPRPEEATEELLNAQQFAQLAEDELLWLKQQDASILTAVRVRDDVEGVMVSRGTLNINRNYKISKRRAFALIQHEIGTHVVTYYNGKAQPLKLFYIGVPGYEQLQEGLAVFSEYLSGGLTNERLRILAARVIAVNHMITGNTFVDTFFLLTDKYQFKPQDAFHITMRVYRGGGLTKDAVYLKGLLHLIDYIKQGKDIAPLLIGKIRQDYIPVINELTFRGLLSKIPIKPRYLNDPYVKKLNDIKKGGNIFTMLN
ncbi:flavohemoglobin expression-modulating QEGLA motif protein [Olivibacter ginsenosidimutans]|uniref:Flavohemoglobin expression-modulating QEGLA motif protein n=1 Tax=Olivibacter ginsenosidimutans TaxID=1176537 RepID=A0ABP9BC55_9SPHI